MNKIGRFVMIILPLVMSFVLGVLLTGWVITKVTPAIYEELIMIIFPVLLISYIYKQMQSADNKDFTNKEKKNGN